MIDKRRSGGGIRGVPGGIKSIGHLVQALAPRFAPSSTGQPPLSTTATGNRQSNRPSQTHVTPLISGGATWLFGTPFNAKPSVQLACEGAPTGTPALWFTFILSGTLYTGATVHSTNASDARFIHITVTGNPN